MKNMCQYTKMCEKTSKNTKNIVFLKILGMRFYDLRKNDTGIIGSDEKKAKKF